MIKKEDIRAVGFDLDGTLYRTNGEIDGRIRNQIAKRIFDRRSELGNVARAREYFERRYKELESGIKILREVGYENASRIMEECLVYADVLDLLEEDETLADVLSQIHDRYEAIYLLTSSPRELALAKLERLGIKPEVFHYSFYSDSEGIGQKSDGSAFRHVFSQTSIKPFFHVYVGDRLNSDILPAKKSGMKTIAVWSSISDADVSIEHIHDIRGVLL